LGYAATVLAYLGCIRSGFAAQIDNS